MNDPEYRDKATYQESHEQFIRGIIESETIWALSKENLYAYAELKQDEMPLDIILFWSDEANANSVKVNHFPEFKETTITLYNFLFRWLPGMSSENVFAGPNWTETLVGKEYDAYNLRLDIEAALSPEQIERFNKQYHEKNNRQE